MTKEYSPIIKETEIISAEDWTSLDRAEEDYGDSWRKRGGIGAFMMLARKWDRIENQVFDYTYDIFLALEEDKRPEGLMDDIKDLRRYLLLVEAHMRTRGK
jgi:hypothetical protein|tara:strand:+ start:39 stop:341 length:303 start_codon:yes stop_codon:yes gene_type:complete